MAIWYKPFTLEELNALGADTLVEHLGIRITAFGDDWLEGTMPVDGRTVQIMRLLHGGASVALAETLGSYASNLCLDMATRRSVGQEINASHLKPVTAGLVTGRAYPVRLGARSHVWQIDVRNAAGDLACVSRLTMAVVDTR